VPTPYPTEPPTPYPTQPPNRYPAEPPNRYPAEPPNRYPTEPPNRYPTEPPTPIPPAPLPPGGLDRAATAQDELTARLREPAATAARAEAIAAAVLAELVTDPAGALRFLTQLHGPGR
jgi:hypothetical protein